MTDTQPLVPTDPEIEAVVQACRERGLRELDVFRAVVVKFGTPALVGREPVAEVVPCYTPSGKRVALYSAKQDLPIGTQLYTAPQPVERAPLTANQVSVLAESAGYWHGDMSRADFINGIRCAEVAHGIKGDQHGTE